MKKIFNTLLILVFLMVASCGDIKRGLLGEKKSSTDEFLVKKKHPLVIPPDFHKLPLPKELYGDEDEKEIADKDIELSIESISIENDESNLGENVESSILKKIKKD